MRVVLSSRMLMSSSFGIWKMRFSLFSLNLDEEASASLPMKFVSEGPGHYPCKILLQSKYDVRLYNILCVVNPEEYFETELEIAASTHHSVIKNIHLVSAENVNSFWESSLITAWSNIFILNFNEMKWSFWIIIFELV